MKRDSKDLLEGLNDKLNGIYRGVVEDNSSDPKKMGRCKVRVFGVHSPNKIKTDTDGIPTNELPWCEPVMGLFEGSISGYGAWTVPQQGSHVMVFFENGHILKPRYFATVPGLPTDKNHGLSDNQGFSDPDGRYPDKLNEPDFNRLARNEKTNDTIVGTKNSQKDTGISTADGGSWSEPSFYNAEYPNNKVFQTKSGITIELDDSNNGQRIHIYHPSNSYIEIGPKGDIVIRNGRDSFEIVDRTKNVHIKNNKNENVDGNKAEKVGGDETETISGTSTKTASIIYFN